MINIIIFISLIGIVIFLNVLLNFCAKKAKKQNNFQNSKSRFFPLIITVSVFILFFTIPNAITKSVKYSSFESYMFWAEGRVGDKEPFGVKAKTQIKGGYIFSFDDHALTGILIEENERFNKGTTTLVKSKVFKKNNEMYSFDLYNIKELEMNILIISFFYDGNEINTNITVNLYLPSVYYNSKNESSKYLMCKSDTTNFNIIIDGANYTWQIE